MDKEQDQLLRWAVKGFPEETVIRENEKINNQRLELKQRQTELEGRIEALKQATIEIHDIIKACELISKNLTELSFENKRLAFDELNIKVWIDGENIKMKGVYSSS